jgi:hypothetical protein
MCSSCTGQWDTTGQGNVDLTDGLECLAAEQGKRGEYGSSSKIMLHTSRTLKM